MTDKVTEEAISWHRAQQCDDADWEAFAQWLESDPLHREAYDQVALLDDQIDRNRTTLAAILGHDANDSQPEQGMRRRFGLALGGGSVLAAAAASLLLLVEPVSSPAAVYTTGPSETRQIVLADGSEVQLAPSSRLDVAGRRQDELTLSGAATFSVRHRPDRSLIVHAGGVDLQDIGTRFDVATAPSSLRVAVAEGKLVAMLSDRQPVHVNAGSRLLVDVEHGIAELRTFPAAEFASWRSGRLVYQDAPLSLVAADISRYSGKRVVVAPDISGRRFSGVLTIGNGSELVRNLADFMGVDARSSGNTVRLVARRSA